METKSFLCMLKIIVSESTESCDLHWLTYLQAYCNWAVVLLDFVNSADLRSFKLSSVDWRSFKPNSLVQVRSSLARFKLGSTTPTFITTYCIGSGWISMLLNQEFNTNHRRSKDPTHWSTISSPTKTTAIVRSVLIYSFDERF